jgi:hypothetical protein
MCPLRVQVQCPLQVQVQVLMYRAVVVTGLMAGI